MTAAGSVPFALLGLDHVVLRVRDMAGLERFYCEVVGCAVERRRPELGLLHLRAGRTMIDLVDASGPLGREGGGPPDHDGHNVDHVCLRVEPFEAEAIAAHLRRHGVEPSEVGIRFGADGEGPSLYLHDPEGNRVELKGSPVA
ncbi:MAG TPA: VOC family protein [Dongiaceae bacterium]|jgi:glyoxylase I family protein|nr:VOC family protein [Dongiaceae bacterium]